jgi:hypothetical protein
VVPEGASTVLGSVPVITSVLTDSCLTVLSNTGYGYAKSNLSIPISISVTATPPSIARPSTGATRVSPAIPTSTILAVTVIFRTASGGTTSKVFTTDPRTVYNATYVNCVGSFTFSTARLALSSIFGNGTAGSVIISVSMPSYAAAIGLSRTITIPVVDVNTAIPLRGPILHSSTPSVPVNFALPLAQIACTG